MSTAIKSTRCMFMRYNPHKISDIIRKYKVDDWLIRLLMIVACITLVVTYAVITDGHDDLGPNPNQVMGWVLVDLVILLALSVLVATKVFKKWLSGKTGGSRLQNRMILMFVLVAAIPTVVISIFSSYFFNFGIQSWFDRKIQAVLDQSVHVAESYVTEHKLRLKDTALSIADDLSAVYYDIIHNPELFNKILEGQREMRTLDEVIVFQNGTNNVLAKTSLSFPLSFSSIPAYLLNKADSGEVVEISTDQTKIRMLIKLHEYNSSYLLIGRLIDKNVIDHINKTQGAAQEYTKLKKLVTNMQIEFSIIFVVITMILLVLAIICGVIFSSYIARPIRQLVLATEEVKGGNLSVQVQEGPEDDELGILSNAFNRMVKQIDHQQKDLIIAQRALAWSDVARRVAHEIKNPLTPIQLSAERIIKKFSGEVRDKEEFTKYADTILRNSRDIGKIVTEFVNFAKMPAPKFEKNELISLVKAAVDSHRILHEDITYHFITSVQALELLCDNTQINQVMVNLLKNAAEAIESSQNKTITIEIGQDANFLVIEVSDSGKGFPVELMDKITEPYITTRSKGTGLGLAIVKKIVEDHMGSMEISNTPGAKVTLTFDLSALMQKIGQSG
jgi:two-component system nitrogen regulation sensor histidine kinase NtrY